MRKLFTALIICEGDVICSGNGRAETFSGLRIERNVNNSTNETEKKVFFTSISYGGVGVSLGMDVSVGAVVFVGAIVFVGAVVLVDVFVFTGAVVLVGFSCTTIVTPKVSPNG
jgi:hypothetical protein